MVFVTACFSTRTCFGTNRITWSSTLECLIDTYSSVSFDSDVWNEAHSSFVTSSGFSVQKCSQPWANFGLFNSLPSLLHLAEPWLKGTNETQMVARNIPIKHKWLDPKNFSHPVKRDQTLDNLKGRTNPTGSMDIITNTSDGKCEFVDVTIASLVSSHFERLTKTAKKYGHMAAETEKGQDQEGLRVPKSVPFPIAKKEGRIGNGARSCVRRHAPELAEERTMTMDTVCGKKWEWHFTSATCWQELGQGRRTASTCRNWAHVEAWRCGDFFGTGS